MNPLAENAIAEFDQHAVSYEDDLNASLSLTGEDKTYYENKRIEWFVRSLNSLGQRPRRVLDYGCGVGSTSPSLRLATNAEYALGVDVSPLLVQRARRDFESERVRFCQVEEHLPSGDFDAAYCNGVFHHINPVERVAALRWIRACLRPGGIFGLWENNTWNPGTRFVMSRCAFDKNALPIDPLEAWRMTRSAGFQVINIRFLFVFPRFLSVLRPIEPLVSALPLGGQYQVLCRA